MSIQLIYDKYVDMVKKNTASIPILKFDKDKSTVEWVRVNPLIKKQKLLKYIKDNSFIPKMKMT